MFMKNLLVSAALVLAGVSANVQAMDWGFQGGLSGSFAVIGDYHLDKKSTVRGFYNSRTVSGVGVSSVGAAYEYDFQPNIYGGLGMQLISLSGSVSGWSAGLLCGGGLQGQTVRSDGLACRVQQLSRHRRGPDLPILMPSFLPRLA